jgi:hypothetical protein
VNGLILGIGAAVAAWLWYHNQQSTPVQSTPVQPLPQPGGVSVPAVLPTPPVTTTVAPVTPVTPVTAVTPIGSSNVTGHYAEVVQWMKAGATQDGQDPSAQNLDVWAYYFQHFNNAVISPDLMSQIVALAGGDRTRKVSAEQFMTLLGAANGSWSGLSGPGGPFIPVRMIHYGGAF